jgi:hypothetical protein
MAYMERRRAYDTQMIIGCSAALSSAHPLDIPG